MSKEFEKFFKESVKTAIYGRQTLNEADDALEAGLSADLDGSEEMPSEASTDAEGQLESELSDDVSTFDPEAEDRYNQKYIQHMEHRIGQINMLLSGWADRIDEFVEFINDPDHDQGIRNILNSAISGTALEKIKVSELKTITKIAADAASLSQSLRSYIGAITTDQMMSGS